MKEETGSKSLFFDPVELGVVDRIKTEIHTDKDTEGEILAVYYEGLFRLCNGVCWRGYSIPLHKQPKVKLSITLREEGHHLKPCAYAQRWIDNKGWEQVSRIWVQRIPNANADYDESLSKLIEELMLMVWKLEGLYDPSETVADLGMELATSADRCASCGGKLEESKLCPVEQEKGYETFCNCCDSCRELCKAGK